MFNKILTLVACLLIITSCKTTKKDIDVITPAQTLYNSGIELLQKNKYKKAAEQFFQVYLQHPGIEMTPKAQLMESYSLFLDEKYDEAIDALDLYSHLYPTNESIAYVNYMLGLANFVQMSDLEYDSSFLEDSKERFSYLVKHYPRTKYAKDEEKKILVIEEYFSAKNMLVAKYYMKKQNPIAAINRLNDILETYPNTTTAPEALYRLFENYSMLGLKEEAENYILQFKKKYPAHYLSKKQ